MALQGKQDLPHSMDSRSGFEMVLLRMLAFTPAIEVEDFVEIIKSDMHNHMVEVGEMVSFAPAPVTAPVESAAVIEPISVIVEEPQENPEEKVDFFRSHERYVCRARARARARNRIVT